MKINEILNPALLLFLILIVFHAVNAQTSSFSYQGFLSDQGAPANGNYDMQFRLFDAAETGNQLGTNLSFQYVQVVKGAFAVQLDFGPTVISGVARFLEIELRRSGGANPWTLVSPRERLLSSPFSIRSLSAVQADIAVSFSGTLSGDVSGPQSGTIVKGLRGREISDTLPTNGQVLAFDTGNNRWLPSSLSPSSSVPQNYVFSYRTAGVSGSGFIDFTTDALINGWSRPTGTDFVCNAAGIYLVNYSAVVGGSGTSGLRITALQNGVEVPGSQAGGNFSTIFSISKSFLVSVSVGDVLKLYSTHSLLSNPGGANIPPASITISLVR